MFACVVWPRQVVGELACFVRCAVVGAGARAGVSGGLLEDHDGHD